MFDSLDLLLPVFMSRFLHHMTKRPIHNDDRHYRQRQCAYNKPSRKSQYEIDVKAVAEAAAKHQVALKSIILHFYTHVRAVKTTVVRSRSGT